MEFIVFVLIILPIALFLQFHYNSKKEEKFNNKLAECLKNLSFEMGHCECCDVSLSKKLYYIENKEKTEIIVLKYSSGDFELKYRKNFMFNVSVYNFKKLSDYQTKYGIFINENERKILIIESRKDENVTVRDRLLEWSDILSVELLSRNKVVSDKSTTSTIGRSVVGGVLGGGVGAVIGGATASTRSVSFDNCYGVRIVVRKLDDPYIEIEFCNKYEDIIASQVEQDAQRLYQLCSIIIDSESKNNKI